ncbi:MAG: hypothetical protein QXT64_07925 [Desulfurococcaceae archaeon]
MLVGAAVYCWPYVAGTPYLKTYRGVLPRFGNYNLDPPVETREKAIYRKHFEMFSKAKLDFVFLSWWGRIHYTNTTAKWYFEVAREVGWTGKIAVFLEARDNGAAIASDADVDYEADYIHSNFVTVYPELYMNYKGLPLLPIWPPYRGTDPRFTRRSFGLRDFCPWMRYEQLVTAENKELMSVMPGCSDVKLWELGERTSYMHIPRSLEHYRLQWRRVKEVNPDLVLVYSFNEWMESSAIEPCMPLGIPGEWGEEYLEVTANRGE